MLDRLPDTLFFLPFSSEGLHSIVMNLVIFSIALFVLAKSADMLIDGAVSLAKHIGVSDFVIGLSLVAFGTSFPELVVSLFAVLKGKSDVVVGNVIGSNIANILLGLGIASLIYPMSAQKSFVLREIPINLLITFVFFFAANDLTYLLSPSPERISRSEGFVLLVIFVFYIYLLKIMVEEESFLGKEDTGLIGESAEKGEKMPLLKTLLFVVFGIAGISLGGNFTVDSAVSLVRGLGLSETFSGLFFIAVGTSLPEIITTTTASFKKNADIAMGNIAGSNIFNISLVLGLAGVISPVKVPDTVNFHFLFLLIANSLLISSMFFGRKRLITKWEGALFIFIYCVYIALSVVAERV